MDYMVKASAFVDVLVTSTFMLGPAGFQRPLKDLFQLVKGGVLGVHVCVTRQAWLRPSVQVRQVNYVSWTCMHMPRMVALRAGVTNTVLASVQGQSCFQQQLRWCKCLS